jgi:uncharacterized iron-regulated membrane protein
MWFDFGWEGVFALSVVFGAIVVVAYRRWRPGFYQWGVIVSLLAAVMASMTLSFRLFYLGTLFELAVGYIVFRHIATADSRGTVAAYRNDSARKQSPPSVLGHAIAPAETQ